MTPPVNRIILILFLITSFQFHVSAREAETRPNVILCMADDLGWGDTGYNGNRVIKTPHLDDMASSGIRFDRFYAASSVCSPTRGSCLTGRHPYRYGVYGANKGHLRKQEISLAEIFKSEGYATGHFGKWHLGTLSPEYSGKGERRKPGENHMTPGMAGFDKWFSTEYAVATYDPYDPENAHGEYDPRNLYWENGVIITEGLEGDDSKIIMDRAVPFIKQAVNNETPFFVVIWFHAPHAPVVGNPEIMEKYYPDYPENEQHYYSVVTSLDKQVGRLRKVLKDLGISGNTMLCFASDNGPEGNPSRTGRHQGSAGNFRGRKRSLYEGGVRVPGIIEYPARFKAPRVIDVPAVTSDYFITCCDLLGIDVSPYSRPYDGISLLPVISGEQTQRNKPIGFQYGSQRSWVDDRYKLVYHTDLERHRSDNGTVPVAAYELYDLVSNPYETRNIIREKPRIAEKMKKDLHQWIASCRRSDEGKDYSSFDTFSGKTEERPNIIFLLTDDLRRDAMGCMGHKHVITPHLDRLAGESVVFVNAYHVSPICMPSRASIMTGQYLGMHGCGFDRPSDYVITEKEFAESYPVLMRKAGYYTGFIGKFGFAVGGDQKTVNHDLWNRKEYMPEEQFDVWYGFPGQGSYFPGKDGTFNGYENRWDATHLNEFMAYQANDFIEKASRANKPFCLSVSFKAPHAPFTPQEHFRRLYDRREIPRMANDAPEYFDLLPGVVREKSRNARWYHTGIRPDWHIELDDTYQAFIKNYYALITGVDDVVGKIRQKLDELGIAGNTVIIFTSDNGFFCGSRQLMGKALLYDESAKAPMIVYDPGQMKDEVPRVEKGLISHVDIAPTLLHLAGIEKPESMPGESFVPLVYDEREETHEAVFGENNFDNFQPVVSETGSPEDYQSIRSKFVRTRDFKYIRYHECHPVVEELWKINEDTLELHNLINDPEFKDIAREMRNKLDAFEAAFVQYEN